MFLMDEGCYYLEQNWYFNGKDNDIYTHAVSLFTDDEEEDDRKLISRLSFDELCGLKEAVDEVFENLLPRFRDEPDQASSLLRLYPWLKEKAHLNPLFGPGEGKEE
jgi:hypothetical protein